MTALGRWERGAFFDPPVVGLGVNQLPVAKQAGSPENQNSFRGVLAQLVERLNGIEEVRGSNPLGSRNFSRGRTKTLDVSANLR